MTTKQKTEPAAGHTPRLIGFWCNRDRQNAWLGLSGLFSEQADSYAWMIKGCNPPLCETARVEVDRLNKLFIWCLNRSRKYRSDFDNQYYGFKRYLPPTAIFQKIYEAIPALTKSQAGGAR